MKRWLSLFVACGVVLWQALAQNAMTVILDVQVIDAETGEIPDLLGPQDFRVYDNGRLTRIQHLDIETPPLDLVFVVYLSKAGLSTREDRQRYATGLNAAVVSLREDDRAGVVRGAGLRGELLSLTGDKAALRQALLRGPHVQPDTGRLFDTVSGALSLASEQRSPNRRRAIIAITDDIERHSETKQDALQESLLRFGVTLHEVILALVPAGPRVHAGAPQIPGIHLPRLDGVVGTGNSANAASLVPLVRATGGEIVIGDNFDTALPSLLRRLRMRYALTIPATDASSAIHQVEVKLAPECLQAHPRLKVTTRIGYYSGP